MSWERPFLAAAAANNVVWAFVVAAAPERVFDVVPPFSDAFAVLIVALGACLGVSALRKIPRLLLFCLLAKAIGPLVFLAAVGGGYVRASAWPLVIVTDLVWIPPLAILQRSPRSW